MENLIKQLADRKINLYLILLIVSLLTVWVFSEVIWTVILAITLAYILKPLNKKLENKGFSNRVSTAISTIISVLTLIVLAIPFFLVLYQRRDILIGFLQELPQSFEITILGFELTVQITQLIELTRDGVTDTAVNLVQAAPSLTFKLFLVPVLVYAILRNTDEIEETMNNLVPDSMKDIVYRYHRRTEEVLIGLYVVQASTAILTFLIGMPVFYLLGYEPFISLALLSGILQLIPILGPTILIVVLAGFEIMMGDFIMALTILGTGLALVALLPDLIIRPRLANWTVGVSSSLYFLGFVGGILTLGAIGIIIGPLMIAILLETVKIISEQE